MKTIKNLAINLLSDTLQHPKMYASNKEALIMRVATILEMVCEDFDVQNFYNLHLKKIESNYFDLNEDFDEKWSNKVITDALKIAKFSE